MSLALNRVKVYVRLAFVIVVVGAIALVLYKNRNHSVAVWFFGLTDEDKPVYVVWLMLATAGVTLVSWWALSFGWGLWRDVRRLRQETAEQRAAKARKTREAELDQREQRIDEKLRRAISTDDEGQDKA